MKHIDSIMWAIVFTDIKDFTLKTSLLTQKQITDFLNKQDEIILPIITKYFWKIVKSIWDSYMIIFEKAINAVNSSIEIQKELEKYNENIDFNLKKIELRISIDYWLIEREFNNNIEDFYWTTVNIASRLQTIIPENKIYTTKKVIEEINNDEIINSNYLWKTSFKWILYEVDIFEISNLKSRKNIKNNLYYLKEENIIKIKEIDNLIFNYSSVAAILWIQPIPFLDWYTVLPFHIYMLNEIAKKYGLKLTKEESKEILITVAWSIWTTYIFSQWIVWLWKIWTFWMWWYIMVPINFWLTYWIWKTISFYFYKKTQWVKATNQELKELFKYSVNSGRQIAKKDKNKIIETGKKYKDSIIKKVKINIEKTNKIKTKIKNLFK